MGAVVSMVAIMAAGSMEVRQVAASPAEVFPAEGAVAVAAEHPADSKEVANQ